MFMSHCQNSSKEYLMPTGLSSSINTQHICTADHSTFLLVTVTVDNVSSTVELCTEWAICRKNQEEYSSIGIDSWPIGQ